MQKNSKDKIIDLCLFLLISICILIGIAVYNNTDRNLHFFACDVGQGDSIYVRDSNNYDIVIDGGPGNQILTCLGEHMPFFDRSIELVVLTHPHADHLVGLIEVIKRYDIKKILMTDAVNNTSEYKELSNLITEKNIPVEFAKQDQKISLGNKLYFNIYWPSQSYKDKEISNFNNTSIVGKLIYENVTFLLTGDAEKEVLNKIVTQYGNQLKSDVYKVAHHGSKNATNVNLIKIVNPEIAIVSAGLDNPFGHPSDIALKALTDSNVKIFRTDQNGTVEIISDGINFWTKIEK